MTLKKFLFFVLFYTTVCFCQNNSQIGIVSGNGTTYIPVYLRQGMTYIPVKLFADVLGIKYTLLRENQRIKFNFPLYNLIVSSKNPYLVLESKEKSQEIIQLPTSTYFINDNIYVPLNYSIDILEKALGTSINFNQSDLLTVGEFKRKEDSESKNNKSNKKFNITGLSLDEKANGSLIRLSSEKKIASYTSNFKEGILYITLKNISADVSKLKISGGKGVIKEIKAKNINNNDGWKEFWS